MNYRRCVALASLVPLATVSACTTTRTLRPAPVTVTARATATVTATTHTTATVTVAPPSPTPTLAVGERIDGSGSGFSAPATRTAKTVRGGYCNGLADPGFTAQCVQLHTGPGTATAVVEINSTQERVLVYSVHGTVATLVTQRVRSIPTSSEYTGDYYSNPAESQSQLSDLALDGTPKLVLLTPITSTAYVNAYQSVDVIEATGHIVLHLNLAGGVARRAFGGGLEVWVPDGALVEHEVIQWTSGAWRVTSANVVTKDQVPVSRGDFG